MKVGQGGGWWGLLHGYVGAWVPPAGLPLSSRAEMGKL